jgi:hypothetical protein
MRGPRTASRAAPLLLGVEEVVGGRRIGGRPDPSRLATCSGHLIAGIDGISGVARRISCAAVYLSLRVIQKSPEDFMRRAIHTRQPVLVRKMAAFIIRGLSTESDCFLRRMPTFALVPHGEDKPSRIRERRAYHWQQRSTRPSRWALLCKCSRKLAGVAHTVSVVEPMAAFCDNHDSKTE